MGVSGMMVIFYVQSWKMRYIAKYYLLLQFIVGPQKKFISGLIDRTFIDITQLG
jgi:hypothetical protein